MLHVLRIYDQSKALCTLNTPPTRTAWNSINEPGAVVDNGNAFGSDHTLGPLVAHQLHPLVRHLQKRVRLCDNNNRRYYISVDLCEMIIIHTKRVEGTLLLAQASIKLEVCV